jgi:hypothetical protein
MGERGIEARRGRQEWAESRPFHPLLSPSLPHFSHQLKDSAQSGLGLDVTEALPLLPQVASPRSAASVRRPTGGSCYSSQMSKAVLPLQPSVSMRKRLPNPLCSQLPAVARSGHACPWSNAIHDATGIPCVVPSPQPPRDSWTRAAPASRINGLTRGTETLAVDTLLEAGIAECSTAPD